MADPERLADVLGDWYERREQDEETAPEDLAREHPELADEIRSHFAFAGLMERALERPAAPEVDPAREIGEYRIVREIGRGGMGVVYEAEQTSMGRRVALKVLSPAVTSVHQAIERFRREARAAGQLHHTSIVPVYGMGEDRGLWYYAMELVEGETLAEVVTAMCDRRAGESPSAGESRLGLSSEGGAGWTRLAEAFAGVAEALETAHREGIIHRDVKPTNLMLSDDGTLKLVDFGLARLTGEGGSMTMTGQLLGTPHYMSPEQARARQIPIDHRTDVYSLGATLYEVLTLRTPFQGDTLHEICSQILTMDPIPPRKANARVPRDLETIVLKAMEKDREKRYPSAEEMARDLRRFAEGVPIRARRIGPVGRAWRKVRRHPLRTALVSAVVVLTVLGGLLAWWAARESERRLELEYASVCARAEALVPRSREPDSPFERRRLTERAHDLYARAIALRPERPEAYLGRALLTGATLEARLADLAAANARGLSPRTTHLARAGLLRRAGRREEAAAEEKRAAALDGSTPLDAYFESLLEELAGDPAAARRLLTRTIEHAGGLALRYLALRRRARLHREAGDLPGALGDLHALQALGDNTVEVRVRIASLWRRMATPEEAEKAFRRALADAREEGDALAWTALCRACRDSDEYGWHEVASEEALRAHGTSKPLLLERIEALDWAGRHDEALALSAEAIERHPRCADLHWHRGRLLADRFAEWEEARLAWEKAAELDSGNAEAHEGLAIALQNLGQLELALAAAERAIALVPAFARAHERRWKLLRGLGREEEARAAMERAVAPDLARLDAHHLSGHALRELGRDEEALAAFESALRIRPRSRDFRLEQAEVLHDLGRDDEALRVLDEVIAQSPGHPKLGRAHEIRGVSLLALRRHEEAVRELELAVRWHVCAELHLARGNALRELGRTEEARGAFEEAIRLDPHHTPARVNLGFVLHRLGKHEEALRALDRAIELDPDDSDAHLNRGALLQDDLGRPEDAVQDFERALELDPDSVLARENLGIALMTLEKWKRALDAFVSANELDPENASLWQSRGCCLDRLGRREEAFAAFRRATELDPDDALTWTCAGMMLGHLDREKDAVEFLDQAIRLDPGSYDAHRERGISHFGLRQYEKALDDFRRAVELRPECSDVRLWLANTLAELRRFGEAVPAYEEAHERAPDDFRIHYMLGRALLELNRHGEARDSFAKAAELNPAHTSAHLAQGLACAALHELADAVEAYSRGLERAPGHVQARWWRATALAELRRHAEAESDLRAVIRAWSKAAPADAHVARWRLALALREQQRFGEALGEQERLREAWPEDADVPAERAFLLACLGRFEDADEALARALRMAPEAAFVLEDRVWTLTLMGQFDAALEAAETLAAKHPDHAHERVYALRAAGRTEDARKVAVEAAKGDPPPGHEVAFAYVCAVAGARERALAILAAETRPWTPFCLWEKARIHAVLGEKEKALEALEQAAAKGLRWPKAVAPDPELRGLARDPRWRGLLQKLTRTE